MKKYIVFFGLVFLCFVSKGQTFIQGGLLVKGIEASFGRDDQSVKGGLGVDFQIGKFINEKKMRSFTINYRFGRKHSPENDKVFVYDPNTSLSTEYNIKRTATSSVLSLGYERKSCFANTEFDDVWQYYNIISYSLSLTTVKEEIDNSVKLPTSYEYDYQGTHFGLLDVTAGFGMARKFNMNSYAFAEARLFFPLIDQGDFYPGAGIRFNFGVRHFIN